MAEPEIVKTVEKAVTTPVSWAKQNPWAFAFLLLVAGFVFLRFSARIQAYLTTKSAAGGAFWPRVARLAGVAAALAIGFFAAKAFASGDLMTALPLMAVAFPTADFVALKAEDGNFISKLTPNAAEQERAFNFVAPREMYAGFPLRVKSVNFALKGTLTNTGSAGDNVEWDKLHTICAGLDIRSPRFDMMARKEDLPGPVLKHFAEYISRGYDYSGDEILTDVVSSAGTTVRTIYFSYNFEQRWAAKPEEFEMFAGWLQGTRFGFWLNKATILSDLGMDLGSTWAGTDMELRAGFRYGIGAVQGDARGAYTVPPLVNYRVFKKAAAGQEDIEFTGIGATGPANTAVGAGERMVAMVLLSDNLGLPGPAPVNDITEIGCEALGIMNTQNVDMFLAGKIPFRLLPDTAMDIGETSKALVQGWPWTLFHEKGNGNLMSQADLLGLPLLLPSVGTKVTKLPRLKGDVTVHARRSSPPDSGQHCLFVMSLRDVDPNYAAQMLAAAGVTGQTTRAVSHDADAAVSTGKTNPASYVGIAQSIKGSK